MYKVSIKLERPTTRTAQRLERDEARSQERDRAVIFVYLIQIFVFKSFIFPPVLVPVLFLTKKF